MTTTGRSEKTVELESSTSKVAELQIGADFHWYHFLQKYKEKDKDKDKSSNSTADRSWKFSSSSKTEHDQDKDKDKSGTFKDMDHKTKYINEDIVIIRKI